VLIGVIAIGIISDRTVSARRSPVAILWVTTAFIISIVFVSFKL
jgi:sugar phosphate permease